MIIDFHLFYSKALQAKLCLHEVLREGQLWEVQRFYPRYSLC